jgi:hypothetical protein
VKSPALLEIASPLSGRVEASAERFSMPTGKTNSHYHIVLPLCEQEISLVSGQRASPTTWP